MKNKAPVSDELILRQIRGREAGKGIAAFTAKYSDRIALLQYDLQSKGAQAEADDIIQEAVIILWQNIERDRFKFQGEGSLLRYFKRVAINTMLKKLRSRKFKKMPIDRLDASLQDNPFKDAEQLHLSVQKANALNKAIKALDTKSRRLITGYYYDNNSYEDLAEELNLANAYVAKQKSYIKRKQLRSSLTKYEAFQ